ncbi:MAG: S8 family peptidase, partial [Patescibacteria group bacterium]
MRFSLLTFILAAGILVALPFCGNAMAKDHELLVQYRGSPNLVLKQYATEAKMTTAWARLALDPSVRHVEPNGTYHAVATPNDPLFAQQWSLVKTSASEAWDTQTGSASIVVAVLDSGIDVAHPDLAANIWTNQNEIADNGADDDHNGFIDDTAGWDFVDSTNDPQPKFETGWSTVGVQHGTVVAGIAAGVGNNGEGITGVPWNVSLMPVRVLDDDGVGSTLTVAQGVQYAVANGADIINLSFVGPDSSPTLAQAVADARSAGVAVVAAAGNDNLDLDVTPQYPVCNTGVIGVGASDRNDLKTAFSNYGSCVDIMAPGIEMTSTVFYDPEHGLNDKYQSGWYGTSAAAPFIAGSLALAWSQNPNSSVTSIESALFDSAVDISSQNALYSGRLGHGRVDLSFLVTHEVITQTTQRVVVAAGSGTTPRVKVMESDGTQVEAFDAFSASFRGGVHIAAGDITGDGIGDIVAGAGNGGGPQVRMFTSAGTVLGSFFAYDQKFRGGVNVATGDVDGNGTAEIIAGAGNGGGPQVRMFSSSGTVLGSFFAFDTRFRGGVNVATGDLDGNGTAEIIAGAGNGGGPQVRIFSDK